MAEFLKMMEEVDEQEIKVPFGELEKGTVYKLLQLKRTTAMYLQKEIKGMHASMETPEGLKIFTYLPKKYVDMKEELFQEINAKGPTSGPYGIAYYGTIGGANMSKLHAPGEAADKNYLKKCAWKRPAVTDPQASPSKSARQD